MTRTAARRTFALLMATVFLLTGAGDLFGVHPCPHHDPLAAMAAGHHDAHGLPAPAEADPHHDEAPGEPESEHAGCTCVGACPTSPGGALAVEIRHAATIEAVDAPVAAFVSVDVAAARLPPYFLPYAQAPPLTV